MKKTITVGKRAIGAGQPCFIIAEAGVNHNGDIKQAEALIKAAKKAGADCVKFQTFKAERVVTSNAPKANYQLKTTDSQESQLAMLQKLELPNEAYASLIATCQKEGILFLSTPYSEEDVDFLDELGVPAFKLASICIAEPSFLRYVASKGKPIIISTGMATLEEVKAGAEALKEGGCEDFVLLQCTTNYPSPLADANLRTMQTMQKECDVLVGYSDHTQNNIACIAAVAMGACVIEKHFTLDKSLPGPDQSTSFDPEEFAQLVRYIRDTETALGSNIKEPTDTEKENAKGMRRSLVAKQDISKGTVLTEKHLTLKRPGTGIPPSQFDEVIGKEASVDIAADTQISFAMLKDGR